MSDNNQNKMQQQMKHKLENLPRYTYKAVGYFTSSQDMQIVIDELINKGIMDLNSRALSENYVEEIYENSPFFKRELYMFLNSFIIGGFVGAVAGALVGRQDLLLPVFSPILSGGRAVIVLLGFFLGAVLSAAIICIIALYKPFLSVEKGYYMLTIYSDVEKKQQIQDILNKYTVISV